MPIDDVQLSIPMKLILSKLKDVKRSGSMQWVALCPAHNDTSPSLSIGQGGGGRALIKCHAGCSAKDVCRAAGLRESDLFPKPGRRGGRTIGSMKNDATAQQQVLQGCTLKAYAHAKKLPPEYLMGIGVRDFPYLGLPALRITYRDESGEEFAVRYRTALTGDDRFRWQQGSKSALYGLWRLGEARKAGYIVIVEGESDCHTLWHHKIPAIGLPGAAIWREDRDAPALDGIGTIYVVVEPDKGGEAVTKWLASSRIRDRVRLVQLEGCKDPSALHVQNPGKFGPNWAQAIERSIPWTERVTAEAMQAKRDAWNACREIADRHDILDFFADELARSGVVGERRVAKIIFLALVTRLLDKPVSVVLKGPSSAGKSFMAQSVLRFFPETGYHTLTAASERFLAYTDLDLKHRFIVIFEAAGLSSEFGEYLLRSLLSEGCLKYGTVEKTAAGMQPRMTEKEGPTGLLLTTTALKLHPENETRYLSVPVTDTPEQTRSVLRAMARENRKPLDVQPWHALQAWLANSDCRASVPYAMRLAELVPPVAIRLRRDFGTVLALIRAHALLHQAKRKRDAGGQIIATADDYATVRELVSDLIAVGLEQGVAESVRETVAVVRKLTKGKLSGHVSLTAVAAALKLDKGSTSRRIRAAIQGGYLRNLEERRGKPMRLRVGDSLPAEVTILPPVDAVRCAVARGSAGIDPSPAPTRSHTMRAPVKRRTA